MIAGAAVIAAIGFAGSFAAVRDLAEKKGFGAFAPFFPIGVDAGIVVLLALDLLLTWIRIPFPLLRQTAWLLTAATIAFNGAAAWPDPLGVGMHAVIPVLFVVTVEAARHATGRVADITADKHMEGVRLSRWLLAFPSTFRLWRRMKLWELRSYDEVIRMEQDRLVYETRLRARYGRGWRRKAPVEALMPLKLVRYGVPLTETAPGSTTLTKSAARETAAAHSAPSPAAHPELAPPATESAPEPAEPAAAPTETARIPAPRAEPAPEPAPAPAPGPEPQAQPQPTTQPEPQPQPQPQPQADFEPAYAHEPTPAQPPVSDFRVPVAPGRSRPLAPPQGPNGDGPYDGANGTNGAPTVTATLPQDLFVEPAPAPAPTPAPEPRAPEAQEPAPPAPEPPEPAREFTDEPVGIPDGTPREEVYFAAYRHHVASHGAFPSARQLSRDLHESFGVTTADGGLLREGYLRAYMREFKERYNTEMGLAG